MGVYERWILPRLLDLAMRNRLLDDYRQRTIETARGLVLEVGVGSGLNLRFYSRAVDRVCGIDLSPELLRLTRERTADVVVPVSLIRASAEHVPFADAAFDAIVMTWTLCSIANPIAALMEMRRVLKPGGDLLFVEHGLSPLHSARQFPSTAPPAALAPRQPYQDTKTLVRDEKPSRMMKSAGSEFQRLHTRRWMPQLFV